MDARTWDHQPFWAQRVYMEGLMAEQPWKPRALMMEKEHDPFASWRGVFMDDEERDALATPDDLMGLGVRVRRKKAPPPGSAPKDTGSDSDGG